MKKVIAVLALAGLGLGGGVAYANHDSDFPCDVEADNTHLANIEQAHELGITAGSGGDACSYSPEDLVRRDQMASFLTNTYDAAVADSAGTVGPAGTNGTNGTNGEDGVDGPAGVDGLPGVDGVDGVDGLPGVDGVDGVDGLPGVDGVDGIDGLPGISPEEIAELTDRIAVLEALVATLLAPVPAP